VHAPALQVSWQAVVTSAGHINPCPATEDVETLEPGLWERHNWRDTSLALAEAISSGTRRFDVEAFLR